MILTMFRFVTRASFAAISYPFLTIRSRSGDGSLLPQKTSYTLPSVCVKTSWASRISRSREPGKNPPIPSAVQRPTGFTMSTTSVDVGSVSTEVADRASTLVSGSECDDTGSVAITVASSPCRNCRMMPLLSRGERLQNHHLSKDTSTYCSRQLILRLIAQGHFTILT